MRTASRMTPGETALASLAPNPHLSDYLAAHVKAGVIDFSLRASIDSAGSVEFYIHPANVSGRTEDYHLRPGKVEVMNKRGLQGLVEMAMNPRRRKFGISGSNEVR